MIMTRSITRFASERSSLNLLIDGGAGPVLMCRGDVRAGLGVDPAGATSASVCRSCPAGTFSAAGMAPLIASRLVAVACCWNNPYFQRVCACCLSKREGTALCGYVRSDHGRECLCVCVRARARERVRACVRACALQILFGECLPCHRLLQLLCLYGWILLWRDWCVCMCRQCERRHAIRFDEFSACFLMTANSNRPVLLILVGVIRQRDIEHCRVLPFE